MSDLDDDIHRRRDAEGRLTTDPRHDDRLDRTLDDRERATRHDEARTFDGRRRRGSGPLMWLLALVVIAALVIGGFFLFGGDVDVDTDSGNIDAPSVDVDVDSPDVSVNTPNVDVDPGSVDVDQGDADAAS